MISLSPGASTAPARAAEWLGAMKQLGLQPDAQCFNKVLACCARARLPELADEWLDKMEARRSRDAAEMQPRRSRDSDGWRVARRDGRRTGVAPSLSSLSALSLLSLSLSGGGRAAQLGVVLDHDRRVREDGAAGRGTA